ncbi:MAG: 4Fe-4S dicluster domain-containing protein [Chloroflexota bacterium]|nr:4Fe-4S dicluster domain-containing protein [Chloroflexota bacterium]
MTQVISKNDLLSWLDKLISQHIVVAPANEGELVLFKEVSNAGQIVLNDTLITTLSPKDWLFPRTETLFAVERKDGKTEVIPSAPNKQVVIFGLHPCDAKGFQLLDKPFLAEPEDTLYKQHRENTTLIGLGCTQACPECFCSSVGTGPHDNSNMDILLISASNDTYIVQSVTDKGASLLSGAQVQESNSSSPSEPGIEQLPTEGLVEKVREVFDSPYWSRVADRCLHCNVCAYVCPTCYCFDIRDFANEDKIERIRTWESCQSPGFTKIAGGHNPRANKGSRLRQRWYHKFCYFPHQLGGEVACVGCGRCVRSCPVNIDIREIIRDIQNLEAPSDK